MRRATLPPRAATALVVALCVALPAALVPASAAPVPTVSAVRGIDDKVSDAHDDLVAANAAVARASRQLESARTALPAAQASLASATAAYRTAKAAADAATAARNAAAARERTAAARVLAARAQIARTDAQIGDLVRAVWVQGPYVELNALLSSTTPSDFADRLEAVRAVSRSQNRALAAQQEAHADLALTQAQAVAARQATDQTAAAARAALATATAAKAQAEAAQARVAAIVAAKASALRVAARNRAAVKRQYAALKAEQARLRRLSAHPRGGYTGRPTGALDWPVPGNGLSGGVGWRVHPVYGYRSCHTGVDIRGGSGTPILAPAPGRVIAVLRGGAYGLHTLIDHGGGLVTMYAHQSATRVHVGEVVSRGEVIGLIGSSGWVTGPHLHWEVHVDGVPYDPLGWFGSPRVPVPCWNG